MKKITQRLWMLAISLILLASSASNVKAQPGVAVSFSVFYDNLAPYGQWINEPAYGYVWVPNVAVGFRPYSTNGYWVNSEYGMTWVSNYPWGWAPFHYGRWVYDAYYGWVWAPDDVWGPAWVDWRFGGGVYGWAPLMPGISIGIALGGYHCPDDWWMFVPQRYVLSPAFYRYHYGPRYSMNYIHSTTIINNTYRSGGTTYISGPRTEELRRATGQPVQVHSVRMASGPSRTSVSNGAVTMYRPRVSASAGGRSVAPSNAVRAERPIGKPQPMSVNNGRPERLTKPTSSAPIQRSSNGQRGIQQSRPQPSTHQARQMAPHVQARQQQRQVQPARPQPQAQPRQMQQAPQQRMAAPQRMAPQQRMAPSRMERPVAPEMRGEERHWRR